MAAGSVIRGDGSGWRRTAGCTVMLAGLLALADLPGVAAAQSPPAPPSDGLDDVLHALDLKPKVAPAPDFVVRSRPDPDKLNYVPVGKWHPDRAVKVMTPAEVAAMTADLDTTRAAAQRKAGLKPAVVPDKVKKTRAKTSHTDR